MSITAAVIADSVGEDAPRITTLQLRYPKFIHGEFMTHRVFSRNASSSRAIPVARMIEDIRRDPAMPVHWGKNQPGMQAREEHDAPVRVNNWLDQLLDRVGPKQAWLAAMEYAIDFAQAFNEAGYHKQVVNRLLEPFMHINVVVTATEWENFFELRRHPDAQPEIQALANAIWDAMDQSVPCSLVSGEWHLPYVTRAEILDPVLVYPQDHIKLSVARCARVSYLTHDQKPPTWEQDFQLYEKLVGARPIHASPAEHQATPDCLMMEASYECEEYHGNFTGWVQYRKQLEAEL